MLCDLICPENFFHFPEKYDISGKIIGMCGKKFSFLGKNVISPENFLLCQKN
jgi:hypothetical protein